MSNEFVTITESCLTKDNGAIKLSVCVKVTKDISRSNVFFNPRGTWASDFIQENHSKEGFKLGAYLASKSRQLRVRSTDDPDTWVLEGEYVFVDRTPVKTKAPARKKAPVRTAPKKVKPVLVREEVKADPEEAPDKKTAPRRTKTVAAKRPRAGSTKKRD